MSHTVSGLIRRAPHIQQGQNANGQYTMFAFELSEFNKGFQDKPDTYTNYSVVLFAKTQGSVEFHTKAIAENSFVVVNADKLAIDQQTGNDGKEYIKLKMMNANLSGFNNPNQQQQQQPAQQSQGYQQPQQQYVQQGQPMNPQQVQQQQRQQQQQQMQQPTYDTDLPF